MSRHRRQRNRRERLSRWRGERLAALFDEHVPKILDLLDRLRIQRLRVTHQAEAAILLRELAARRPA
jgi:hypothetical protein